MNIRRERMLRHFRVIALLAAVIGASSCKPKPEAPSLSVAGVTAAWSGGRNDPVCSNRGPRGEFLGGTAGAEHCQWPTVTRGAEFGTVSATRDSLNGWTSITWERVFTDSARATMMLDSLETAFTDAGLLAHRCSGGGRRWQSPSLAVQSFPLIPRPAGGIVVTVIAVEYAIAIPSLFCPDAPEQRSDPRTRTGAI